MLRQREKEFSVGDVSRIIEMAWEDRTSFDAIRDQFGLTPAEVIDLMRREMKPSSFKMWRKRTAGRKTKHIRPRQIPPQPSLVPISGDWC